MKEILQDLGLGGLRFFCHQTVFLPPAERKTIHLLDTEAGKVEYITDIPTRLQKSALLNANAGTR